MRDQQYLEKLLTPLMGLEEPLNKGVEIKQKKLQGKL